MATTITANGINFPDGSAGSPSIGGTDTNTGLFTGSDIVGFATGGSERLRIDASGNINIANDSGKLRLGTGADLELFHDSSHSRIHNNTGLLLIECDGTGVEINSGASTENMAKFLKDGAVELYHNNSKRLETTSVGVKLLGSGTDAIEMTGDVWFNNNEHAGKDIYFNSGDKHLIFEDEVKAKFGGAGDLQLYHDGSDSFIDDVGTGNLFIRSNHIQINKYTGENMIKCLADGAVELYHDNSKKIETAAGGVTVTDGDATVQVKLISSSGTAGYFYGDGNNEIGILDSGGNWAIQHLKNTYTTFSDNNASRLRIDSDGIKFGSETAAANALDAYEEGTWTPSIVNGWGILNPTYDEQVGLYVKIGKLVHVLLRIDLSGGSTNGNRIAISNFPFTAATVGSTGYVALNGYCDTASSNAQSIFCMVSRSGTTAEVFHRESGGESSFTGTELGNTGTMNFSGTFTTT